MMNLRQKVKQAKKELESLVTKSNSHPSWKMYQQVLEKIRLEKIIDYKKKATRHYHWNEEYQIDWEKLTYIGINVDGHNLGVLKSPNGTPLKTDLVNEFLNKMLSTKVYNYARTVSTKSVDENKKRKHVDYYLTVSNDKSRAKKLHIEKMYYQFEGDDKLHNYEKS